MSAPGQSIVKGGEHTLALVIDACIGPSSYEHSCFRRAQKEQTGFSPEHLDFLRLVKGQSLSGRKIVWRGNRSLERTDS